MLDAGVIVLKVDQRVAFGGAPAPGLGGFERMPKVKGLLAGGQFHADPVFVSEGVSAYRIPLTHNNLRLVKGEYAARPGWVWAIEPSEGLKEVLAEFAPPEPLPPPSYVDAVRRRGRKPKEAVVVADEDVEGDY